MIQLKEKILKEFPIKCDISTDGNGKYEHNLKVGDTIFSGDCYFTGNEGTIFKILKDVIKVEGKYSFRKKFTFEELLKKGCFRKKRENEV